MNKDKYIKISKTDFLKKVTLSRSEDNYFRSLEAYLVKNNCKYNIYGEDCFIYVKDKDEAMLLGINLNLFKIMYFDGKKLLPITLTKKRNKGDRKIIITNNLGEKISVKNLKEQPFEAVKKHCFEKKEIIKKGMLTKKELEDAVKSNKLNEIIILNRSYFDYIELAEFIKNKK